MTLANFKAVTLLFLVFIVWLAFIVMPFGWYQLFMIFPSMLARGIAKVIPHEKIQLFRNWIGNYTFKLWVSNDQYINSVFGGNEDHTISGRVGFYAIKGNPVALVMEFVINLIFWVAVGQKNHCRDSIEWDEMGKTAVPVSYKDFMEHSK